jgi:hypothetical protein
LQIVYNLQLCYTIKVIGRVLLYFW